MDKLKQAFNKASSYIRQMSPKKKLATFGGTALAFGLATEMLVMPAAMSGKLEHWLDDAIRANDGAKVTQVLNSHYADGMWGGVWASSNGNDRKAFLAPKLAEATRSHDYAALEALLKNDVAPYSQEGTRSDDLFFFVSYNVIYENAQWRSATLGEALKNADTKALDIYNAHGIRATEGVDDIDVIRNSRELIVYYMHSPDKITLNGGRDYDRQTPDLLAFVIRGASAENALYAIEQAPGVQGTPVQGSSRYLNQPLRAAIMRAGDRDPAEQQAGLAILDALLKHGANPNADVAGGGYRYDGGTPLYLSLKYGSPESSKHIVQAGGEVDELLRSMIRNNENPSAMRGWDASVKAAASDDTRQVLAVADQQRALLEKLQEKAPGPQ